MATKAAPSHSQLPFRIRRIIGFLLENEDDVENTPAVQIVFNCKDHSIMADVVKKHTIRDTGPLGCLKDE
jgi:hypothetical protein